MKTRTSDAVSKSHSCSGVGDPKLAIRVRKVAWPMRTMHAAIKTLNRHEESVAGDKGPFSHRIAASLLAKGTRAQGSFHARGN